MRWGWALAAALLLGCAPVHDPSRQITGQIEAGAAAIASGDVPALQDLLAPDFSGPDGMDREQAAAYAAALLSRHAHPDVDWSMEEVILHGPDRATTRLRVSLAHGPGLAMVPGAARKLEVRMGWKKVAGRWRVVSAIWAPPMPG